MTILPVRTRTEIRSWTEWESAASTGLSFYGQGLASLANGGILKFSLDVTNPNSPPQLVPSSSDIKITLQTPDTSTSSTGTTGTDNNGSGGTQIRYRQHTRAIICAGLVGHGRSRVAASSHLAKTTASRTRVRTSACSEAASKLGYDRECVRLKA